MVISMAELNDWAQSHVDEPGVSDETLLRDAGVENSEELSADIRAHFGPLAAIATPFLAAGITLASREEVEA